MKQVIRTRWVSVTIRAVLIVLGVSLIAGYAFLLGMAHANRKAAIQMANDECIHSVWALSALKDPEQRRLSTLLDEGMDSGALKLSDLCLRYPHDIKRMHYNALVRVQAYRKKYGRAPERSAADMAEGREADAKVAQAIAYLESIHDTNRWRP